jgi:hypothetical protein
MKISSEQKADNAMSDLERLLVAGCTEMPECRCGKEMRIDRSLTRSLEKPTLIFGFINVWRVIMKCG